MASTKLRSNVTRLSKHRRLAVIVGLTGLLATACAAHAPQDSLKPAGPEARYIDHLFYPVFWIAVAVVCLVVGIAGYCMVRFRARSDDDRPVQTHGNPKLEVTWTLIPFLLLVGVGAASVVGVFHLARTPKGAPVTVVAASATEPAQVSGNVLRVNVVAHRWWFEFRYPGMGPVDPATGQHGDLVTAGELHLPVGKEVYLSITSREPLGSPEGVGGGVMHNFWIPRLAGKVYAVPGRTSHLIINADAPGIYAGQCTEYCGLSHANMRVKAVAQDDADFVAWVLNQQQPARVWTAADQFTAPTAYAGYLLFNGAGTCSGCHTVSGTNAAGQVGPNLTHLQARGFFAGDIFTLNDNNLRLWLRNPQAVKPGANMRIPHLTEDQITALIAYLDTLK